LNREGAKDAKGFWFFRIGAKPIRKRQRLGVVAANPDCLQDNGGCWQLVNLHLNFGTDFTDDTVFLFEPRRREDREGFLFFPDRGKTDQKKATPWGRGC